MSLPLIVGMLLVLVSCNTSPPPASKPTPVVSPSPLPTPVKLRPPAEAILADTEAGLPRLQARDHLTAAEAASLEANQPLAFERFTSWGWVEESTRRWSAGAGVADDLVLQTLRSEGAHQAYEHYVLQAEEAPYSGGTCPAVVTGLDECFAGTAPDRTVITGRLGEEVFVMRGTGMDVAALAAAQAARLRA